MKDQPESLLISAESLRREFDHSFTVPVGHSQAGLESFVAIRVGGYPFALRVAEIERIERRRQIVALPVQHRGLIGVAGIQGRLLPVYRLSTLLGIDANVGEWRWVAACRGGDALSLAFETLEAYFSVPESDVLNLDQQQATRRHVRQAVRFAGEICSLIDLPAIQADLHHILASADGAEQESLSCARN